MQPDNDKERPASFEKYDVCVNILKAIANFSSVLLSDENLDNSVNEALKILGKSIEADRLNLLQHCDDPTGKTLGYVAVRYEWTADGTKSQLNHPQLKHISYDGVEDCYCLMLENQHWGGLIDSLPEPFKSGQLQLGVKATYAIPVIVRGDYWGIVALDFCRVARQLEDAEIETLKTAASCIGGAIEKERISHERERVNNEVVLARQKSQVLTERDRLLNITASAAQALLNDRDLEQSIDRALQIVGEGIEADRVAVMEHCDDSSGTLGYLQMLYEWHLPKTVSQLHHPDLNRVSYEGIEDWYEELSKGNVMGGMVKALPEPIKSRQLQLGVKSTYSVPITIEGQYWGIISFDDCNEAKQRSATEISILKTTAVCIGSAIEQNRSRQKQKQAEYDVLLEQHKAKRLQEHNEILGKRDRILVATAEAANVLSIENNFDVAVNKALQIIGKTLNTDRVTVIENWHNTAKPEIPHWRLLYEWNSPQTISQISHSEFAEGSYEGIEEWFALQSQGKSIVCKLADIPEPFRHGQEKLGVKVIHGVPIFIEGRHWGIVGIDDCHRETNRSEAEISILKTVAACIGGAIERERSHRAKEEAEKAILLEREKAALEKTVSLLKSNQILSLRDRWLEATANAANKLLQITDLDEAIDAALKVLGESLDCDRTAVIKFSESRDFVRLVYEWNSSYASSQISNPEFAKISSEGIEDWLIKLNAGNWIGGTLEELKEPFRTIMAELDVKSTYSVPIFINGACWGAIGIDFCREPRRLTAPEIAVFKTAASCIGSAMYRQQIRQDKEQAELAILNERNRIAREIHDTLAQSFTGISLQLEAARSILETQPEAARERLFKAKQLAKEGIAEARRSVRALRPETLKFNNLAIALPQLLDSMTSATSIETQTIIQGEPQLTPDIEMDLYRIAQEAITNTLRHARATQLTLSLISQTSSIELQIKDNGIGFKLSEVLNDSFGLIGMQERCDRHNGNLLFDSSPENGTSIIVKIAVSNKLLE